MTDPANEAQARIIAKQLFDVWKAEEAEKQSKVPGSWPAWLALVLSAGALIWAGGGHQWQITDNTRRIEAVEDSQARQATDNQQVLQRLASIEAKLDLITEERNR